MARSANTNQIVVLGVVALVATSVVVYYTWKPNTSNKTKSLNKKDDDDDDDDDAATEATGTTSVNYETPDKTSSSTSKTSSRRVSAASAPTPTTSNKQEAAASTTTIHDPKALHAKIEALDKEGKTLFKAKKYVEAAAIFTDALDVIAQATTTTSSSDDKSLARQVITLTNNRSAMYEKGGLPDLALEDCSTILDKDPSHTKARTRKLRILESQQHYQQALVEVCALQLLFLQEHRDKLRMGIPVTPPVPQTKLEELMTHVLPQEIEIQLQKVKDQDRPLPSNHTIVQLLKSFTGYNTWMAAAAKDGSISKWTKELEECTSTTTKASLLFHRGRRYAFELEFEKARLDFEEAYALVQESSGTGESMPQDEYCRLLEWVGMVRHWKYDLKGALQCYEQCCDLEPINAELLVKRAGVKMDGGHHDEALELFDAALGLNPDAADALLHRGNLRMLQSKVDDAKSDLQQCLRLRPDHVLAQLRLATILMAVNDIQGAKQALDEAERMDPESSEVHSYRGEMHFAQQEFTDAKVEFDKAIACEPGNPTPYVNAALAVMNTPGVGGLPPDVPEAMRLLELSIQIDPQFQPAYVHLGQLKLSMATDLRSAQQVVELYDKGLSYCRSAEELKDICSMRLLTVAQVDAAKTLKMETLNMQ